MRTTLNTIYGMIGNNLNKFTSDMWQLNSQISSGLQMSKISDNPINVVSALGKRSTLAEINQYQSNISFGGSMISAAEDALTGIKDLVMTSKTRILAAINDSQNSTTRTYIADELHVYLEEAVALGNSRLDGKYVFGGYRTTGYTETEPTPFMLDYSDGYRIQGSALPVKDMLSPSVSITDLAAGDLVINGIAVSDDVANNSVVFPLSTAGEKAAAINRISSDWVNVDGKTVAGTGVTAKVIPVFLQAQEAVAAGTLGPGDLVINGVDIFAESTDIVAGDTDNVLLNAINSRQDETGIAATRDANGNIGLKAVDGRNLHIQTTANGNDIARLNGPASTGATDKVYSGTIQLLSEHPFMLESTVSPGGEEPGFAAIGLSDGSGFTGEAADKPGDGKLSVLSFSKLANNVRYTGDRDNGIEIKVGVNTTMGIAKNGEEAVSETGVFKAFKDAEDYLRGTNYTFVTSPYALDKDKIGTTLESLNNADDSLQEKFRTGDFTISVTDHDVYPPLSIDMKISVDITVDTPESIARKINGISGLQSSWDSNGQLHIESSDPDRYTFDISDDSSNTLNSFGIQNQGLTKVLDDLDGVLTSLSTQIADFGARANRITIQNQIYSNLELANQESLSEVQDADLTEVILQLKTKEIAYQAALSAAAKTMQLSLVDYLT